MLARAGSRKGAKAQATSLALDTVAKNMGGEISSRGDDLTAFSNFDVTQEPRHAQSEAPPKKLPIMDIQEDWDGSGDAEEEEEE